MDADAERVLSELAARLTSAGFADALWVGGSLATGDYVPGVSDVDLVAVTPEPLSGEGLAVVRRIHADLDAGSAQGLSVGCQYADRDRLLDVTVEHPTWSHGELDKRSVSLVTRAELVLHGFAVLGPAPAELLPPVTPGDVRAAAHAELTGYWSYAARRPALFWRHPVMVDLGLTAMARGRHSLTTGELLTKTAAIEQVRAPRWLQDDLRARRQGQPVTSPPGRSAYLAWRDVRQTTSSVRRSEKARRRGRTTRT